MKKRSNFAAMKNLIHLVKPLTGYMILAILMGLLGHLCASFITIFGAFGVLQVLGMRKGSLGFLFIGVAVFAVLRGILRYTSETDAGKTGRKRQRKSDHGDHIRY